MAERRASFQFYPNDFLTSEKVARMSMEARGVYITLLCFAWNAHGIPNFHDAIAKLVGIRPSRLRALWAGPLGECFIEQDGRLVNPRQERQRQGLEAYIEACSRGGKHSADSRRATKGTSRPLHKMLRSEREVPVNTSSSSSSSVRTTVPASPAPLSYVPNENNGNYRVIEKLATELLNEQAFESEGDLIDATKAACATRGIDYGRQVDATVVHRACASAAFKHRHPELAKRDRP